MKDSALLIRRLNLHDQRGDGKNAVKAAMAILADSKYPETLKQHAIKIARKYKYSQITTTGPEIVESLTLDPRRSTIHTKTGNKNQEVPDHDFYAKIESCTEDGEISGWAYTTLPNSNAASFTLLINNAPVRIFRTTQRRDDVIRQSSRDGRWGFRIKINSLRYMNDLDEVRVEIRSPYGARHEKKISSHTIKRNAIAYSLENLGGNRSPKFLRPTISNIPPKPCASPPVSLIMLNLNGGSICLQSIASILNRCSNEDEIIVVDHGSTEDQLRIIRSISDKRLRLIERGFNYSYSQSNNYGAKIAVNPILIFINNDIIIEDGSLRDLTAPIQADPKAVVGAVLYDTPIEDFAISCKQSFPKCIQHCGIEVEIGGNRLINASDMVSEIEYGEMPEFPYAEVPAATGAVLAISASHFSDLNGFKEEYFYGQEDVDICLRNILSHEGTNYVSLKFRCFHYHGITRLNPNSPNRVPHTRLQDNRKVLDSNLCQIVRSSLRNEEKRKILMSPDKRHKIAFIVSETTLDTSAADIYTAYELAQSLSSEFDADCYFIKANQKIEGERYTVIVNMLHSAELSSIRNISGNCIIIAWMRNWFDKWCTLPDIDIYDLIYCTSSKSRDYVSERLNRQVNTMPIAASKMAVEYYRTPALKPIREHKSYAFIGSYFNSKRELAEWLDPRLLEYEFRLFGHGWENHPRFNRYSKGPLRYHEVFNVYDDCDLVIDDANIATKKWGSVNSRIFDSLAMGVPIITNGREGSIDTFSGILPVYDSKESLHSQINRYMLGSENSIFKDLQKIVLKEHQYCHRARQLMLDIQSISASQHVRINTAIPNPGSSKHWGDLYLARSIRNELMGAGLRSSISIGEDKSRRLSGCEDIILNIRGLENAATSEGQSLITWIISHPEMICLSEIMTSDIVAIASESLYIKSKEFMSSISESKVHYIPQFSTCSKHVQSDQNRESTTPICDFIFIGNTRNIYRESVMLAVKNGLDIKVIGKGWNEFIDSKFILSEFASNHELANFYRLGRVALCDHWDDMKSHGFISNRIYDLIHLNMVILSDSVRGLQESLSFYEKLYVYSDEVDFVTKANAALSQFSMSSKSSNADEGESRSVEEARKGLIQIRKLISDHAAHMSDIFSHE
jgi:GT2 family glycosyltransferase/spore maturation protein CgeB